MEALPKNYILQNRYLITRKVAKGGFGITYEAIDQELKKKICIKELYIDGINKRIGEFVTLSESKKEFSWSYFIENFKREAQKIAEFRHSNIISVYSVFEVNGTAYYVMEYVEGENLREHLNRLGRPFTQEEILPIAAQIFDAVDTVHSKSLLHRDIKPENFLITGNNKIILIDFGSSRENIDEKTVALLASTTIIMLTHGYSAPEMYSNLSVKGRYTDIYSIGATFYYLLSLKSPLSVNDRQFVKMPLLNEVNPDISDQLSNVVMKAMEMKEEERFQNIVDFRKVFKIKESKVNRCKKLYIYAVFFVLGAALLIILSYLILTNLKSPQLTFEPDLIYVEGGSFTMGCTIEQNPDCYVEEKPSFDVVLDDFYIGKNEVTLKEFSRFISNSDYVTDAEKIGSSEILNSNYLVKMKKVNWRFDEIGVIRSSQNDLFPVLYISWNDANAYCNWLSEKTGKRYRLPTEAEWEYAARGGKKSKQHKYSGSNKIDDIAWFESNSKGVTNVVGLKSANELGVLDMSGNVWEWCNDWFEIYNSNPKVNPNGPLTGNKKVLRGGSFINSEQRSRVTYRKDELPNNSNCGYGFRVVRDK